MGKVKGALGLDTVKVVIISLLIISVIAIIMFLAMSELLTSVESAETLLTGSVANESITANSTAGTKLAYAGLRNCLATVAYASNASGTAGTANYTTADCTIIFVSGSEYEGSNVNVSYTYTYNNREAYDLTRNVTQGPTQFFKNVPTFMVLLGVVVLVLIIAIVIAAVSRFSGGTTSRFGGESNRFNEGI